MKEKKKKTYTIIINGVEHTIENKKIKFEEIVSIAYEDYKDNPNIAYTVTYSKGPDKKPKGQMVKGDKVNIKDGMIFNATRTNKS